MAPAVTIQGIDEAISNLDYRNRKGSKSLLVRAIRAHYEGDDSVQSVISIDSDTLITTLWASALDPVAIRNRRRNLSSIKSSVNADLKKLYREGKNPEGITISPANTFVMSDEAKDSALEALRGVSNMEGVGRLDQLAGALQTLKEALSSSGNLEDLAGDEKPAALHELRDLIIGLSRKIGIAGIEPSGVGENGSGGSDAVVPMGGETTGPGGYFKETGGEEPKDSSSGELEETEQVPVIETEVAGALEEEAEEIDADDFVEADEEPAVEPEEAVLEEEVEEVDEDDFEEVDGEPSAEPEEVVLEEEVREVDEVGEEDLEEVEPWEESEVLDEDMIEDAPEEDLDAGDSEEGGDSEDVIEVSTEELPEDLEELDDEGEDIEDEEVEFIEQEPAEEILEEIDEEEEPIEEEEIEEVENADVLDAPELEEAEELEESEVGEEVPEIEVPDELEEIDEEDLTEPEEAALENEMEEVDEGDFEEVDEALAAEPEEMALEEEVEEVDEEDLEGVELSEEPEVLDEEALAEDLEAEEVEAEDVIEFPPEELPEEVEETGESELEEAISEDEIEEVEDADALETLDESEFEEVEELEESEVDEEAPEIEVPDELDEIDEEAVIEAEEAALEEEMEEIDADDLDEVDEELVAEPEELTLEEEVEEFDEEAPEIEVADEIEEVDEEAVIEAEDAFLEEEMEEIDADDLEETDEAPVTGNMESTDDFREEILLADAEESGRLLVDFGEENLGGEPGQKQGTDNSRMLAEQFNRSLAAMDRFFNQYILVPDGKYPVGKKRPVKSERSKQVIELPAFYMGKYPVTNALFEVFIEKTGYKTTAEREGYGTVYDGRVQRVVDEETGLATYTWSSSLTNNIVKGACWYQPLGPGSTLHKKRNHPVVQVSLEDAMAFAAWTGKGLPKEDEWEAASRTSKGYLLPWGRGWEKDVCNFEDASIGDTTPVDFFREGENDFGIADTLGNVWEWTSTPYENGTKSNAGSYVAKGGSWVTGRPLNLATRMRVDPASHSNILGFRCVAY